ncbi:MAG: hypothetical protein CDJEALGM_00644 [Ignavibacteria bacterium]|nr:hypothetical protein [Ignavibacteria bacterium]
MFTTFKISGDDDVFWHLATGKYVVDNNSVPSNDIFGWATANSEWMPFEWGWDVVTYFLFNIGGYTIISVFRTLIFLLLFFIYYLTFRKLGINQNLIAVFFVLIAFGIIDRLTPRPHIISLLFFAILLYILISVRYKPDSSLKGFYFIPALFLIWSNFHMGVIAGIFILLTYFSVVVYEHLRNRKTGLNKVRIYSGNELFSIGMIFFASVLCLLINPNGYDTFFYSYGHTQMKLLETINEWRSPFDEMFSGSFVNTIYKAMLALGLFTAFYSFKTKDYFPFIIYLVFAIYSVRAVRFTVDYLIVVLPFLVLSLNFIISSLKSESLRYNLLRGNFLKIALSLILIYAIIRLPNNELYLEDLKYYRVSGFGIDNNFIPVQLFDFMEANKVPAKGEKVLNHFGTGGYFIWRFPDEKNFIDSRNLNDEIFGLYRDLIEKKTGFEKKLTDLGIDYAIYLAPDLVRAPQEMRSTIISYFENTENWKLVFWDDKSFLYLKDTPGINEIISKFEYKYITPYNFLYNREAIDNGMKFDSKKVINELKRKHAEEPDGIIVNSILQTYNIRL